MEKTVGFGVLMLLGQVAWADLVGLDNAAMEEVAGQAGIGLGIELRLNANEDGSSKCGASIPLTECRLALGFNNRGTSGSNQEWLVLKGVSGRIYAPYIAMEDSLLSYTADGGGGSSNGATVEQPALLLTAGGADNKWRIQNFTIANMAVETDVSTSMRGYVAANENGFMGLRIDDQGRGVELAGSLKVFPCNPSHPRC